MEMKTEMWNPSDLLQPTLRLNDKKVKRCLFVVEELMGAASMHERIIPTLYDKKHPEETPLTHEDLKETGTVLITPQTKTHAHVLHHAETIADLHTLCLKVEDTHTMLAFSGVRNMGTMLKDGWRITCTTGMKNARESIQQLCSAAGIEKPSALHTIPEDAKLHAGVVKIAHRMLSQPKFKDMMVEALAAPVLTLCGFSMGGAMAQVMSGVMRACGSPKLVAVSEGSPRTGNKVWAEWLGTRTEDFTHLHLIFTSGGLPDPITTLPNTHNGYATAEPIVLSVDGEFKVDVDGTHNKFNAFGTKGRIGTCLTSLRFMRGFTSLHRMALHPFDFD